MRGKVTVGEIPIPSTDYVKIISYYEALDSYFPEPLWEGEYRKIPDAFIDKGVSTIWAEGEDMFALLVDIRVGKETDSEIDDADWVLRG